MHHSTQISDEETKMLAGVPVSSSLRPRRGDPVILSFQADRRRYLGLEDAMEPDEGFEPLGSIAVRLVARWALPRMKMLPARGKGGVSPALASAHDPWEEET